MTLREFVDREARANPALARSLEAFETQLLEGDATRAELGATHLVSDQDTTPREWCYLFRQVEETRRAIGLPPLDET